jgi:hypothetical protein
MPHPVGGHQVGDAAGDDAGLAATRAGENEEGAFGVLGGLTLAGVEALEEIHEVSILPWGRNGGRIAAMASVTGRLDQPSQNTGDAGFPSCTPYAANPRSVIVRKLAL